MRLTALALVAALAVAGCGDDEPEETQTPVTNPQPRQPPATDTSPGDTAGMTEDGMAGEAGERQRADGGAADRQGQASADGRTGGERAGADGGTAAPSGQRLYTIQVAAFTESSSATEWEGRLRSQGLPVWTSVAELGGQTFYRVRVGTVESFSEARRLGSMISARYQWPVWVAPVTPSDRPPSDAIQRTRTVLESG